MLVTTLHIRSGIKGTRPSVKYANAYLTTTVMSTSPLSTFVCVCVYFCICIFVSCKGQWIVGVIRFQQYIVCLVKLPLRVIYKAFKAR